MPVTGCSSSAGTCSGARLGLLAVAERHPRLDVGDVAGALGPPARRDARADADRVGACRSRPRAAARCRRRRAGSARTRTACRAGACRRAVRATHVNACTVPRGPTSIQWSPSGATAALVVGSYSVGGTSTRPSASRTARMRAVAQPGEEPADHGPDRAGVAARVLEHVLGREDVGQRFSFTRCRTDQRGGTASDRAVAPFPVRVAELALQQLAGRLARQLVDEVDAARPLVLAEPLAARAP